MRGYSFNVSIIYLGKGREDMLLSCVFCHIDREYYVEWSVYLGLAKRATVQQQSNSSRRSRNAVMGIHHPVTSDHFYSRGLRRHPDQDQSRLTRTLKTLKKGERKKLRKSRQVNRENSNENKNHPQNKMKRRGRCLSCIFASHHVLGESGFFLWFSQWIFFPSFFSASFFFLPVYCLCMLCV
jgi:hypothetical protein